MPMMWKQRLLSLTAVVLASCSTPQDPKVFLEEVAKTLDATHLHSIQYSGSGYGFRLGHSPSPGAPWAQYNLKKYAVSINYDAGSRREEQVRTTDTGEQRRVKLVSGQYAWDGAGTNPFSAPHAVDERRLQIWLTPHGLVQAAMANNATLTSRMKEGRTVTEVSFLMQGTFRVNGIINDQNLVEKVDTWVGDTDGLFGFLGDMLVETIYSDYRDFNGVLFPTKIVQKQGGSPVLDITVSDVLPNAPVDITVPETFRNFTGWRRVSVQRIADGVWYLTGFPWHSVAVEFTDHIVVVEAPFTEDRSLAVIDEVRKTIPDKPIRYVVNTHHHFEHTGGLRAYAAAGATIITHTINKPYYEKIFAAPRTLNPDSLSRSEEVATFESFTDKYVLTDGRRTMELYLIRDNPHADGLIMAYLPKEKLLIEADAYPPSPADAIPSSATNPATVNLYTNIQRLGLDVRQIAPLHGRLVPMTVLLTAVGEQ